MQDPVNPTRGSIRVVVIDDHPTFRQMLAGLLRESREIDVIGQATDGTKGIEAVRRSKPDVILLNYHMPTMNGAETAREIRHQLPHTGIIGLSTAVVDSEAGRAMASAGADAFFLKGTDPERLIATIRRLARDRCESKDQRC